MCLTKIEFNDFKLFLKQIYTNFQNQEKSFVNLILFKKQKRK